MCRTQHDIFAKKNRVPHQTCIQYSITAQNAYLPNMYAALLRMFRHSLFA
jgi:hypothetical protein